MGVRRFALSPEDGLGATCGRCWPSARGSRAVVSIVHQDTPQFLAESLQHMRNLIGGLSRGKANCSFESMEMDLQLLCGGAASPPWIFIIVATIVLNQGPSLPLPDRRLKDLGRRRGRELAGGLRVSEIRAGKACGRVWRAVRAGRAVAGGHAANFDRGME